MKHDEKIALFKHLRDSIGKKNIGASVVYSGDVKMKKTGNPLRDDSVTKVVRATVKYNHSYESAVQGREEKATGERTFEGGSLPWGQWEEGYENCILEHTNKKGEHNEYVRLYFGLGFENEINAVQYFVNGQPATDEQIAIINEFKNSSGGSKKQEEVGVEKEVKPISINVKNITEFKCGDYSFSE